MAKKKAAKKKRAKKYESKLLIQGSLEDVLKISIDAAKPPVKKK